MFDRVMSILSGIGLVAFAALVVLAGAMFGAPQHSDQLFVVAAWAAGISIAAQLAIAAGVVGMWLVWRASDIWDDTVRRSSCYKRLELEATLWRRSAVSLSHELARVRQLAAEKAEAADGAANVAEFNRFITGYLRGE